MEKDIGIDNLYMNGHIELLFKLFEAYKFRVLRYEKQLKEDQDKENLCLRKIEHITEWLSDDINFINNLVQVTSSLDYMIKLYKKDKFKEEPMT